MTEPESLAHQLDAVLLGGQRRFTRSEAAAAAGISLDEASELWHALGFASVADDDIAFTDGDVTALRNARGLLDAQLVDADLLLSVTRMVGQSMSRLADWQSQLMLDVATGRPDVIPDGDLAAFVARVTPALEQVQVHVWRRQLAAAADRLFASGSADPRSAELAVGFVDLAGYTSLSRRLDAASLAAVLEEFEAAAAGLVATHHGRIVKTIGDEVLFTAPTAVAAAEIALGLLDRSEASARLPQIRAGLALGPVLTRFGDVFGPVVNIASRLTGLARVGTVLVDRAVAQTLEVSPQYELRRLRAVPVRGYHHLAGTRLRRRSPQ